MSDSNYRIPRMTLAVMVLGAGCDDNDGEEGGVSHSHIARIASDLCQVPQTCGRDVEDEETFTSEQACVDWYVEELKASLNDVDESCGAAGAGPRVSAATPGLLQSLR